MKKVRLLHLFILFCLPGLACGVFQTKYEEATATAIAASIFSAMTAEAPPANLSEITTLIPTDTIVPSATMTDTSTNTQTQPEIEAQAEQTEPPPRRHRVVQPSTLASIQTAAEVRARIIKS